MKLHKLTHSSGDWQLNDIVFKNVNLIVGKNAVGKSKTIEALNRFVSAIVQSEEFKEYDFLAYKADFILDNKILNYSFICTSGKVTFEELRCNDIVYLSRNDNSTILKREERGQLIEENINPPFNKLTINVRRDTIQYPFIENLINWAENSYGILFNRIASINNTESFNILSNYDSLLSMFEKLNDQNRQEIVIELKNLDYSIENIVLENITEKIKVLHINETGVKCFLWEALLSQGMLRTLFLLVLVKYLSTLKKGTQTIVIDDFCEGLDYDRSLKLGKYIYSFCLESDIQLITTSNDSFLMDVVDLQYWNILQREGSTVTAISKETNPELFNDFEFTGLSNFDLFSSDFIARHKK